MIGFYRNNKLPTLAVLFSILLLPVACNKSDPKEHLQRGVEYFKNGDYEKAKLELKNSSQSDKNTAETYYYLALLDEKNQQYKAMRENLTKVVEMEPKNIEARLKLGKLLLPFNEPDAALAQAETVLKDAPGNLDALALKASVYIRRKNQDDALAILDGILQKNPNFVDALSLKALIYSGKGEQDKALALLDVAMKADPKNVDLHYFKIQLHAKANDMDAVLADYQNLAALYPDNQDYKTTLARLYTQAGKTQEAEAVLRDMIKSAPKDIKPKLLLLDFLLDTSADKVGDQLKQFVEIHHSEQRRLLDLANWTINRKRFEEADRILNLIVENDDDDAVVQAAKTLMAKVAFDHQDMAKAESIINEILEDNSNYNDAKILQARILLANKQYTKASELLNKVLLVLPEHEEALLLSAQVFMALGDSKKANQFYEAALKVNPANVPALLHLYDKAVAEKNIKYAKDIVTQATRYDANNLVFLEKLAYVSLLDNDIAGAKEIVQRVRDSSNPLATDLAQYLQAKVVEAEGDCNQAITLYKALLNKFPGNKDTLDNMAGCYEKLNKRSDMIAVLKGVHASNPGNAQLGLMLADLLIRDKKAVEADQVLSGLLDSSATKVPQVFAMLAKLKVAQNDSKGAVATLQAGLKQNPGDIRLTLALAALYEQRAEYDAAKSVYEAVLKSNPNLEMAINSFAVLLTEHYNDAGTLAKAVEMSARFKDSEQPYYRDTYAWALIKQGKNDEGITVLQDVITRLPDVPIFRYHLGVAYANVDNNGSALAELQQALELAAKLKVAFPEEKEAKIWVDKLISKTRGH